MKGFRVLAALPLMLAACNSNTAAGADREAHTEAAPTAAPQMSAAEALSGIATEAIALETLSDADIASLGGYEGHCVFRTTKVAFPSFYYRPGDAGAIKLNGKLIPLSASEEGRFSDGDLAVELRSARGEGGAGPSEHELILMLPEAKDELGYRGYLQCFEASGDGR